MTQKTRMPRRTWGSGRGALGAIALLLIASGVVRLGAGSGAAIALELKDRAEQAFAPSEAGMEGVVDITPDLVALLQETQARERAVAQREAELKARTQTLALVESAVADSKKLKQNFERPWRQRTRRPRMTSGG